MAKKINVDLKQVEELAAKGYNVTMVCNAMGISRSKAYSDTNILDAIKKGSNKAKQNVIDHLMKRSIEDQGATASIYLAKQLKVFEDYFTTSKPKSIKEAIERIATIYDSVSKNELDSEKGSKLVGYLEAYIKAYEVSELEERISVLENSAK